MGIAERIGEQIGEAMRRRNAPRLAALRNMRAALLHEMKKDGSASLDDEAATAVLRRLEKQRGESIEAFQGAGRADRAAAEEAERAVIREFLPSLADEDTTLAWVEAAIADTSAQGPGDLGRVMGAVMKAHRGEVDGALARRLAARCLGA